MMGSIETRLRKLEALKPAHVILEITVDGETRRMTVREFVAAGYDFLEGRIISGNDLEDVKLILDTFPSCIT